MTPIHPVLVRESPNQNHRPLGEAPSLIVIHGSAGRDAGDLAWIMDARAKVSYHELIHRDGGVYQVVDPLKRAWHAGKSSWEGRANVNDYSIGIALSNLGPGEPFTLAQYYVLAHRVQYYMDRFKIPVSRIVGHHMISGPDVRTDPKSDPWSHFDWEQFFWDVLFGEIEGQFGLYARIAVMALVHHHAGIARAHEWWK